MLDMGRRFGWFGTVRKASPTARINPHERHTPMKQLAHALRSAGYLPSNELRAQRDAAIGALVKARKAKRKSAPLKAKVLTLVAALKVPTPIGALITLLAIFLAPSVALAHPGHDGHHGPDMNGAGALVLVGVTLGLAAHAWTTWGPRRRLVASVEGPDEGPAGGPEAKPTSKSVIGREIAEREGVPVIPLHPELAPYYTVKIPPVVPERATQWHCTDTTGPFAYVTRGCHRSLDAARAWADSHLDGNPYTVVLVSFNHATGDDDVTTVYTFNPAR